MAFENINWGMLPQAAQNQQSMMLNQIAQGIALGQAQQDRDLKMRQLQAREQLAREKMANQPMDYKQIAQDEIFRIQNGLPPTPQGQAAIGVMRQTTADQVYVDPILKQVMTKPSPWRSVGATPAPSQAPTQNAPLDAQLNNSPDAIAAALGVSPQDLQTTDLMQPAPTPLMDGGMSTYKAGGILANTRAGALKEEESKQRMQEAFDMEKMKRRIQGVERFNGEQLQAANFANRMIETSDIIDNLSPEAEQAKTGAAGYFEQIVSAIPSMGMTDALAKGVVKISASPEQQKYLNAAQNWIRANLRKESGAVIGPQEMIDEYSTYFPTAGDTKEVIAQKKELRKQATAGMVTMSAGSFNEAFPDKAEKYKNVISQQPAQQNQQATPNRQAVEAELRRRGLIQ